MHLRARRLPRESVESLQNGWVGLETRHRAFDRSPPLRLWQIRGHIDAGRTIPTTYGNPLYPYGYGLTTHVRHVYGHTR